jgi:uncharacterized protein DUF615
LLDHFKPFAVLAVAHQGKYCKSLGVKSTELWESSFVGVMNASTPEEEYFNGDCCWKTRIGGCQCKMDKAYKSRTRRKNEDRALQRLGEQLVALPFDQLETMGLPDELLTAIELARKIKSHGARRRQIQYIGALMRHIDPQPIETALNRIRSKNSRK